MKISAYLFFISLFFISPVFSQSIDSEIRDLEEDFKSFHYQQVLEKGKFLLDSFELTKSDSLIIFQYMLNASYALNDTIQAENIIAKILYSSPEFNLDPKITSPKIIEFFNYVKKNKIQFPQEEEPDKPKDPPIETMQPMFKPIKVEFLFASLLIPGSGHLLNGQKTKGYLFTGVSSLLIGGIIFTAVKSDEHKKEYMNARKGADFDALYDTYNSYYKTRNMLLFGYGLFNLYTLYDFYKSERNRLVTFNILPQNNTYSLKIVQFF